MRCWVRNHPVSADRLLDGSVAQLILSKAPMLNADFSLHPAANPRSRAKGLVRWQLNPNKEWGPKARAARGCNETIQDKMARGEARKAERKAKRKAEKKAEVRNPHLNAWTLGPTYLPTTSSNLILIQHNDILRVHLSV